MNVSSNWVEVHRFAGLIEVRKIIMWQECSAFLGVMTMMNLVEKRVFFMAALYPIRG